MPRNSKPEMPADPLWYKDAVIYQLHIKSFFDSNDDGVGDLPGLIAKLDYIESLGVDAVWLLPFYPSPRRDDGYDIAEYKAVHPEYGSLADIKRFIQMAHARNIRVITELVINHTSDQHPWFQRARKAKPGSAHRDYYVWSDTDKKYDGTRIIFLDTEKSNWTWDAEAGAYFWHRFYSHQPDLNFDNPQVMKEVTSVMRFWLDAGVDGLRLDAIPYLIERDGTNNENLPETHVVLKKIRAELDKHAPGRMLLAEANQWPEDTQQYFGDGDECHMAFHFPLMPRMYMAMAQEDRFPITDILRQTPEIPENCQWAIFLRNHDELTLEMVTDKERDYLWETYASDKRARINLGIRRRLAPLLEHDRRRIELMNSLLLSMPGTPVMYYGDEIGMGDNIHLGDRDGVRTPMQWSPDRNGGFSRATPAQLVLPAIMDPVYGFEAVNVEAQSNDPHSLLNWTRRMLAVRKRHKAFGRGSFGYLYPGNRKILAYLREHEGETILCVCNLSRTAQAVELDLSAYAGRVPVELVGGSSFPPIGQLTYLLTLPPYGFYWFLLATEAAMPSWHTPAPEAMSELSTLVLRGGVADVLAPAPRKVLEQDSLPQYLARRRWFAGKDGVVASARLAFAEALSTENGEALLAEVEVPEGEGTARYLLPLGIIWEDDISTALPQQLALARVRRGRRVGLLTDAFALDSLPQAVLRGLRNEAVMKLSEGEIRFLPTSLFDADAIPADAEIRRLSAEQSNSSLIIGDHAVLKLVRRVTEGISPETEMTRHLTERGFGQTAPLLGEVVRVSPDGTPRTLVVVQGFVRNQGDGWGWTIEFLNRSIAELAVKDNASDEQDDAFANYAVFAGALGRRLGEMHALLAEDSEDAAFRPEPASEKDVKAWAKAARAQFEAALKVAGQSEEAAALRENRAGLLEAIDRLAASAEGTLKTRIHGDFHLGQVLVVQGDACIIDFEGEPAKTLAQRRAKSSPLRDVAGLLRSFDYAVASAEPGAGAGSAETTDLHDSLLEGFRQRAAATFLEAYRAAQAEAPRPWSTPESEAALLDLFLLEKAAYEVCYEAANRPGWLHIPLGGLSRLAHRLLGKE
ncbi:maltose alpha-D-glucosyltransferase [Pseudoroseomonas cervicalis]|uniref:maltose alpha-D-glucosyltransferase n=1 Tax=Teichococcus cervicalis TaxID=204525 RepID=UPI002788454C|nr:maltose alpha-D-glucosyltransferase [Pseudoroseomonas cervicalis]MDQ1078790.1 maltose alpha-D-glucosyltransferase/alpha-amylase [Pseudoroseomonas cervicalis]